METRSSSGTADARHIEQCAKSRDHAVCECAVYMGSVKVAALRPWKRDMAMLWELK